MGVGNPSRGDDALGPLCLDALAVRLAEPIAAGSIELLTDFQLQIELIYDIQGRERVIFVDASLRAPAPYAWGPIVATADRPTTSHALAPEALLACHERLLGAPPPAWLMAIRGERFELGEGLTDAARAHLDRAVERLMAEVSSPPAASG